MFWNWIIHKLNNQMMSSSCMCSHMSCQISLPAEPRPAVRQTVFSFLWPKLKSSDLVLHPPSNHHCHWSQFQKFQHHCHQSEFQRCHLHQMFSITLKNAQDYRTPWPLSFSLSPFLTYFKKKEQQVTGSFLQTPIKIKCSICSFPNKNRCTR